MVESSGEVEQALARRAGADLGVGDGGGGGAGDRAVIGRDWSAPIVQPLPAAPGLDHDPESQIPPPPLSLARAQARRLIAAANELLDLAAELEQAGPLKPVPATPAAPAAGEPALDDEGRWLRHARQSYRRRRSRALFFDESLFGEPAWDVLLDLFIAAKERKRVPVTSACIGAAVPTTTALRWLTILEDRGLVLREADPTDARRIFVRLTADAYAKMVAYFARAAGVDGEDGAEFRR